MLLSHCLTGLYIVQKKIFQGSFLSVFQAELKKSLKKQVTI